MSLAHMLLSKIPPVAVCLMMMAGAAILSIVGTLVFHRFVPHRNLKVHNDITGPIFSTLGVVYAVLLGFMVIVVWQNFDRAKMNVEMEVNCLANLYVDSESFQPEFRQDVRRGIGVYIKEVIEEWKTLETGKPNPNARTAIERLIKLYSTYQPRNETEKVFFQESVGKINELLKLRVNRMIAAREGIHPLFWFVLITGGVITIIFTIFFGTDRLNAKIVMSALLAVLISLVLFTILEFSLPFTGSVSVSCESFKWLLAQGR